jgi:hypothetical protein
VAEGVKPEVNMVYAGSKPLVLQASDIGKVFEIRTQEDLTEGDRYGCHGL